MFRFILTAITLLVLNAYSYTFNVSKIRDYNDKISQQAIQFVRELAPLIDKPLSWCQIEPTGEIELISNYNSTSTFSVQMKVSCDERKQRAHLEALWYKYRKLLDNPDANAIIHDLISNRYKDIKVKWGLALNDFTYLTIIKKSEYGGTLHYNNKVLFFKFVVNGNEYHELYRVEMQGNLLTTIETNQVPTVFTKKVKFLVEIDDNLLSNNVDLDIIRVWHTNRDPEVSTEYQF